MGIIIHDEVNTPYGIDIKDTYSSFGNSHISATPEIINNIKHMKIESTAYVWANKLARYSSRKSISHVHISTTVSIDHFTKTPLFTMLYNELKRKYISVSDI